MLPAKIQTAVAYDIRFHRGLLLPVDREYEDPEVLAIAVEQQRLHDRLQELDAELRAICISEGVAKAEEGSMTRERAAEVAMCMRTFRESGLSAWIKVPWELYPVILGYSEGKMVQINMPDGVWCDVSDPSFLDAAEYRIKPEPKYRPFTAKELVDTVGKNVTGPFCGIVDCVSVQSHSPVSIVLHKTNTDFYRRLDTDDFVALYKFDDGTPCGVKVE